MQSQGLNAVQPARVEALKQKHSAIKRKIERERGRPSSSDWYLSTLKREKLRLKDEIAQMQDNQIGSADRISC